ncbi:MAG: glycosyltransferase family 2 protein [Pseudomonadales bacterium]|nr:glycosyltransferase family 2 protein [Pseudomonadales bacterium]
MPVTVVVVSYQSASSIGETLESIGRCRAEGLVRCVVVDNNSTDGTQELVRRRAPWARLIEGEHNVGFARGCNVGLDTVATPYTLFLNPDACIEPDALRTLLVFLADRPEVGAVGPATICRPAGQGEVLQLTGALPTPRSILPGRVARALGEAPARPIVPGDPAFETGWICGAVLLARTTLLKSLGGFDPRFFLYWEETDLCLRIRHAGFAVCAVPGAVAHHRVGVSSRDDPYKINGCIASHYYASRRLYMLKHYPWSIATLAELVEWVWLLGAGMLDVARGRGPARLRTRLQAQLFALPAADRVQATGGPAVRDGHA